jgi:hypothetical protein
MYLLTGGVEVVMQMLPGCMVIFLWQRYKRVYSKVTVLLQFLVDWFQRLIRMCVHHIIRVDDFILNSEANAHISRGYLF